MKKLFAILILCAGALAVPAREVVIDIHAQTWPDENADVSVRVDNAVELSVAQSGGTTAPKYYPADGIRIYKNNTVTLRCLDDETVSKIVFTYTTKDGGGLVVSSGGGVYSEATTTWTGSASQVVFQQGTTATMSGPQVRITSITVTLSGEGGGDDGGDDEPTVSIPGLEDLAAIVPAEASFYMRRSDLTDGVLTRTSEDGNIVITQTKHTGSSDVAYDRSNWRLFAGHKLSIQAPDGYGISDVMISCREMMAGSGVVSCSPQETQAVYTDKWTYSFALTDKVEFVVADPLSEEIENLYYGALNWVISVKYQKVPTVTLSKEALLFDLADKKSDYQIFRLNNYTGSHVTIQGFSGLEAPFSLYEAPALPDELPSLKARPLAVAFAPLRTGVYRDTLVIHTSEGDLRLPVAGVGSGMQDVFPMPAKSENGVVSGLSPMGFTFRHIQGSSNSVPGSYGDRLIVWSGQQVTFQAPARYVITGLILESDEEDAGPNAVGCTPAEVYSAFDTGVDVIKDIYGQDSVTVKARASSWKYIFDGTSAVTLEALPANNNGNDGELHWRKITVLYDYASAVVLENESLSFVNVLVNAAQQQVVRLMNYTAESVTLNSIEGLAAPYSLSDALALPLTVPAGESVSVRVVYRPTETGTHTASMMLRTSAGDFTVALSGNSVSQTTYPVRVAPGHLFYDFTGKGEKGFVDEVPSRSKVSCVRDGLSTQFAILGQIAMYSDESRVRYIEDVNRDGTMDFGNGNTGSTGFDANLSQGENTWERMPYLFYITNFDLNRDGRFDYLHWINGNWKIGIQQTDGSFAEEGMNVMYKDQYEASFDATDWTYRYPDHTPPSSGPIFSGVCLAKKPGKHNAPAAEGIGSRVGAPTKLMDLNMDGYMDLVDEKNGIVYYNMFDGKWVKNELGGNIRMAYLDGDDVPDFIVAGNGKINTLIYRGNGVFDNTNIWDGFACDDAIHCYDFDKDGEVEILATFSTAGNSTGAAYTMFFDNDGKGNFTMQPEQTWTDTLTFSTCQDIDGDGYMDLLAMKADIRTFHSTIGTDIYVYSPTVSFVWFKGGPGLTFAAPQELYTLDAGEVPFNGTNIRNGIPPISAEDIDNDGVAEIWQAGSGIGSSYDSRKTTVFKPYFATPNTAPTAPAAPSLLYNAENGQLTVNWGHGSDAETSACDLTYALRIGTTAGGDDILRAHANADGSRRNFLDGNMGQMHSYTIDLSSYAPSDIYVAVQAIDAQHKGSAWSEESVAAHTYITANFTLSATTFRYVDSLHIYYTPYPADYTFAWEHAGGNAAWDRNGQRVVAYAAGGEQSVTLTVTAPDGTTARSTQQIHILPNGIDTTARAAYTEGDRLSTIAEATAVADYNNDGHYDYALSDRVYIGGENYTATRATGMWAANLDMTECAWYDYDHDGYLDLLYQKVYNQTAEYGYVRSNGAGGFYASAVSDANVSNVLTTYRNAANIETKYPIATQWLDINNDGYPDGMYYAYDKSIEGYTYYFLSIQPNGTGLRKDITIKNGNSNVVEWRYLSSCSGCRDNMDVFYDLNHDGLKDMYYIASTNSDGIATYTGMYMAFNKGDYLFEEHYIPFPQAFTARELLVADMNSDGYADIVGFRSNDYAPFIIWNNENQSFSDPEVIAPAGDLQNYKIPEMSRVYLYDFDNNGYLDLLTMQNNSSLMHDDWYIHFFGEEGLTAQGFVSEMCAKTGSSALLYGDLNYDGLPDIWADRKDGGYIGLLRSVAQNEKPQAPTGVTAVQTDEGLLIQWNDAEDDATPASMMRYNLSVKKKGATGAGAYIVSPQNGGNANAAPMPASHRWNGRASESLFAYPYIESTQYIMPLSALPEGEVEIQVQAIDMWGAASEFSATVTAQVEARAAISAPIRVCAENTAKITYTGVQTSATPTWDFDGGTVLSGSGFGPYEVVWSTPGTKQIGITLNGKTSTRNVAVTEPLDATFGLPAFLTLNNTVTFDLPRVTSKATFTWLISVLDGEYIDIDDWNPWPVTGRQYVEIAATPGNRQGKATLLSGGVTGIRLKVQDNGCEAEHTVRIRSVHPDAIPDISYVAAGENNKYVIHWNPDRLDADATGVIIYKEGSYLNDFYEVGTAEKSAGEFVDPSSNATVRTERYAIALAYGSEQGMKSKVHQPIHMTINRGMTDGQYNLIWNPYTGAQVATYRILRGTSPDNLQAIANLSAANTSYTDNAPSDEVYYAIEYELYSPVASAPSALRQIMAAGGNYTGRSNTVSASAARNAVYATRMNIVSVNGSSSLSNSVRNLLLYAEIYPSNATYQQVQWSVISGQHLAAIDQNGLVTAREGHTGGKATIQATTMDGSNLTATFAINVAAIAGTDPEPVVMTGFAIAPDRLTLTVGETAALTASVTPAEAAASTSITWQSSNPAVANVSGGTVSALSAGIATITATATCNGVTKTATCQVTCNQPEGLEETNETSRKARKVLIDNVLYILLPDGHVYDARGQQMK